MTNEERGTYESALKKIWTDLGWPIKRRVGGDNDVLNRYLNAMEAERRSNSGYLPIVCVAGKHDYESLMGTLQTLFGAFTVNETSTCEDRLFKCMNVTIVPCYSIETGFYFGSEDTWHRENKNKIC